MTNIYTQTYVEYIEILLKKIADKIYTINYMKFKCKICSIYSRHSSGTDNHGGE